MHESTLAESEMQGAVSFGVLPKAGAASNNCKYLVLIEYTITTRKAFFVATTIAVVAISFETVSAATLSELQEQLKLLTTQIAALQSQSKTTALTSQNSIALCPNISRNIRRGLRGEDVRQLQQYLISQNLLAQDSATGFFGSLTEQAVQQWQTKNGIASGGAPATTGYGSVGPKTRAAIARMCSTTPQPVTSCAWSGQAIANGSSVTAYQSSSVASGQTCAQESRFCSNGTFSGSYQYASCSVQTGQQSCSWNDATISNGTAITAYQASAVAYGSTCQSQTRSCANGTLSGSYQYSSCTVSSPITGTTLNVRDYGAKADGTTDDAPAIQKAINDSAAGRGTVYIPHGAYKVATTLHVTSHVRIVGDGLNTSVLLRTADYGDTIDIGSPDVAMAVGVEIRGLHLLAQNDAAHPVGANTAHIRAYGLVTGVLENLQVSYLPYNIDLIGGAYSKFTNLQLHGSQKGDPKLQATENQLRIRMVALQGIPSVHIFTDSSFTGNSKIAMRILAGEDLQIQGGLMGGGEYNISIEPNGTDPLLGIKINGVNFDGALYSEIKIDNNGTNSTASNISINNNTFNGEFVTNVALWISGGGTVPTVSGFTFNNNNVLAYNGSGMNIYGLHGGTITGNTIRAYNHSGAASSDPADTSAIYIGNATKNVSISGNTLGGGLGSEPGQGHYCVYVQDPTVNTNIVQSGNVCSVAQ